MPLLYRCQYKLCEWHLVLEQILSVACKVKVSFSRLLNVSTSVDVLITDIRLLGPLLHIISKRKSPSTGSQVFAMVQVLSQCVHTANAVIQRAQTLSFLPRTLFRNKRSYTLLYLQFWGWWNTVFGSFLDYAVPASGNAKDKMLNSLHLHCPQSVTGVCQTLHFLSFRLRLMNRFAFLQVLPILGWFPFHCIFTCFPFRFYQKFSHLLPSLLSDLSSELKGFWIALLYIHLH